MRACMLFLVLGLSGCAYQLGNATGHGVTRAQAELDSLTCKDRATTAANDGAHVAGEAALGATLVALPAALAWDRSTQRHVYADCMASRGYTVTPPK